MKYKYTVYVSAIRRYEAIVEASSKEEAKKLLKLYMMKNKINDYEDELMSIKAVEE